MADRRLLLERGLAHQLAGRLAAAEADYRAVLRDDPRDADALHLLGVLAAAQADFPAAIDLLRQALAVRPDMPMLHNNLGNALAKAKQFEAAAASYRRAIELAPDYAEAHFNLATALSELKDHLSATIAARRAVELAPRNAKAAVILGLNLMEIGRSGEAIAAFRHAQGVRPDIETGRFILQAIVYDPAQTNASRFAAHRQFEADYARAVYPPRREFTNVRDPDRPLRIGWLSSDLREHSIARNLWPIFERLDRQRFDMTCYADVARPDHVTAAFRDLSQGWRDIRGRSDGEVADLIRGDRIDILMLLAGRFDRNRPLVAAHRAAPVQVSLYDAATSGLETMDYLIADSALVPRRSTEGFVERVVRLPSFYTPHAPPDNSPAITAPPCEDSGTVTFGCFSSPVKISDEVMGLWAAVLQRVPNSRLFLKYADKLGPQRERLQAVFARRAIAAGRLVIGSQWDPPGQHLQLYRDVDVALDPFPFTGSTSTFEALWMGVPVVTLLGDAMAGRWSASMLHTLALGEWIARTPDDYVEIAARLAEDRPRLAAWRAQLRDRVARSPLCNGALHARRFGRLVRALWRRWCFAPSR